jgi:large conductance mechanosensitive channel
MVLRGIFHLPLGDFMLNEFKAFIAKGNVLDMAVGIIIGAAFTAIVGSLVADIINPVIGMIIGGIDFSNYYVDLSMGDYASLEAAKKAGAPLIMYGLFINAIIKFLIVAFVVFILVKNVNRLKDKMVKAQAEAPAATPEDIQLLREIRDALKK